MKVVYILDELKFQFDSNVNFVYFSLLKQLRRDSAGGRTLWPVLPPLPALPPGQTYSHMSG